MEGCIAQVVKILPVLLLLAIASSALGYSLQASAQVPGQVGGAGGGTPQTASNPAGRICGNHPCAPGEVYVPGTLPNGTMPQGIGGNYTMGAMGMHGNYTMGMHGNYTMGMHGNYTMGMHGNYTMGMNGTMGMQGMMGMHGNYTMGMYGNYTKGMGHHHMHGNGTMGMMGQGMNATGLKMPTTTGQSPRAQVAAGVQPQSVQCPAGFYLLVNTSGSRPACVTQSTMSILEARGWGHAAP